MSVVDGFRSLAGSIVDDLLRLDPVEATWLGDHRFDARLPQRDAASVSSALTLLEDRLTELDAVDDVELPVEDAVDLEILRAGLLSAHFNLGELRAHTWNPMEWNPGTALHLLVSRDSVPADERRASVLGRLDEVPDYLADARAQLDDMPAIHVETAIAQLAGTSALIDGTVRELVATDDAVERAAAAVEEYSAWLSARLPVSDRSPRLGARLHAAALWHSLDDDAGADELLAAAYAHLDDIGERLRDAAAGYLGIPSADDRDVRRALDAIADRARVTDDTVLSIVSDALGRTTRFTRDRDIVEVPDVDVRVIVMPEIHRGVAVAYCDAPGPLEQAEVPTFVAVSPTPVGWDDARVASFYREYNAVQLHDLTIHEAMPGHVLQLAHAQRLSSPTEARRFGSSGVFVEGWAVYAEEVLVDAGYAPDDDPDSPAAIRLQQLKMQARSAINTILDIGVHGHDMSEVDALTLMRQRGFQEEGEAVGKWRRALLTSAQLPTYFAGYRAVRGIASDLRVLHPDWSARQVHDLMLSKGSPAPRHLRTLLGI